MSGSLYDTEILLESLSQTQYQDLVDVGADDPIDAPAHYTYGTIEVIDMIFSMGYGEGFCLGNAIKYIARWKFKGGLADLKKARKYLDMYIEYLEENPNGKA